MKKMNQKDIMVVALIAVVLGLMALGMDAIYTPLTAIFGPLGGAILYGIYLLSATLPMALIKKPGIALVGSVLTGLVNLLFGSPYGINIIVAAVLQGLGVEAGSFLFKNNSYLSLSIGSILAMLLVTARDYFIFGFGELGKMIPVVLLVRLLSSVVLGGLLAVILERGVRRTGVMQMLSGR